MLLGGSFAAFSVNKGRPPTLHACSSLTADLALKISPAVSTAYAPGRALAESLKPRLPCSIILPLGMRAADLTSTVLPAVFQRQQLGGSLHSD